MVMLILLSIAFAIDLKRCHPSGLQEEAYCGTHSVWENPKEKSSTIDLHVVVLPAVKANPAPDPLFVLAGGPGQGASDVAATMMPMLRVIHQQRTIVFLDQRGTGQSGPLNCDWEESNSSHIPTEELQLCLQQLQVDVSQYTTEQLAQDTDDVRKALGYEKINLYGGSYGTRLGLSYMRNHPDAVRSAVLDGVAPLQWPIGSDFGRYSQRALDSVFLACEQTAECDNAYPMLRNRFQVVLAQLDKPKVIHLPHPITYDVERFEMERSIFLGTLQQLLYDPTTASLIPYIVTAAYDENWAPLMAVGYQQSFGQISVGLYLSIVCAEDIPRIDMAAKKDYVMGNNQVAELKEMCSVWPTGDVDPRYFEPVVSSVPVLLLSGEHDPITPPENGELALQTLSNAVHVSVPGMAHNTLRSECMLTIFQQFVDGLNPKQLELSCVAEHKRPPFVLSPSGTAP